MLWLMPLLACSGGDTDPVTDDDLTCDHGDVNRDFGFVGVDVSTDLDSVHQVRIAVKLTAAAPLEVRCTLDSDPDEVHRATSDDELCHEIDLHGLLADRDYSCVLTSLTAEETVQVRTALPPEHLPAVALDEHDPDRRTGAYTLVSHLEKTAEPNQLKLLILDPEGRVRWSHLLPEGHSGDLDAQYLGDGRIFYGGASGLPPTVVKLSGRTEWTGPEPSLGGLPHHHVELRDDGDVLMLSTLANTDERGDFTGFSAEKADLYAGTVRWAFDSQVAVDGGQLGRVDTSSDPWHANALVWVDDADGEGVLASLYGIRHLLRLDPLTHQVLWRLGAAGDFQLLDASGAPLDASDWFVATHAPELNGDRLLLYDNGNNDRGSRVVELALDTTAWTAQETWSWTEPGWREPIWGDVDALGDDHVLITRGHCAECSAATPDSRSEILELDRSSGDVVWRVRFPNPDDGLYRAERIDGCALFANDKYCG